jgi:subtilisin-like proprotein convertase family protein
MAIRNVNGNNVDNTVASNNENNNTQQSTQQDSLVHSAINTSPDAGRDNRLQSQFSRSRNSMDAQRILGQVNQGLSQNQANTDSYQPIRRASVNNIPMAADVVDRRLSNMVSTRPARNMPNATDLVSRSNSPREASKTVSLKAEPNSQIQDLKSVSSVINVTDDMTISQVKVNIDIAHTYVGDLVVKLRSPEGKEVLLKNREGGSADNLVFEANPADFNGLNSKGEWSVVVEDKANQDTGTFKSWNLSITGEPKSAPPTGGTITKTATPNVAVKDNQTATSFIDITDEGQIENLKVNVDIDHTYRGDLVVKLKSPSGKEIVLHNKTGGSADNLQFELDRTEFANEPVKGRWTLSVEDTARQDEGTFKSWGLSIKTKGTTPPPPPPPPQQGKEVVVAVFDGGVDYTHSDLDGNMWVNRGEVAGDGVDNDNNGIVDDVFGLNTSDNTGDPFKGEGTDHGTHVAGIVAAEDNGQGTTGVAAKSNVKIMSVGGMYDKRDLLDNFEAGVDYVIKMKEKGVNVKVINCSFSKIYNDAPSQARWNAALNKLAAADIMLVASGGNTGRDVNALNRFPNNATQPNIITVAALDTTGGKLASFSSFGDKVVELAAPGEKILSTVPGNKYEEFDGTSMAAPHVAAAASILFSKYPTMTAVQAREIILSSVDLDPDLTGKVSTGGKLNIEAALAKAASLNLPS